MLILFPLLRYSYCSPTLSAVEGRTMILFSHGQPSPNPKDHQKTRLTSFPARTFFLLPTSHNALDTSHNACLRTATAAERFGDTAMSISSILRCLG